MRHGPWDTLAQVALARASRWSVPGRSEGETRVPVCLSLDNRGKAAAITPGADVQVHGTSLLF